MPLLAPTSYQPIPVGKWHKVIADPIYADAILDRLVHNARSRSRRPQPATPARQQSIQGLTATPPNAKSVSANEAPIPCDINAEHRATSPRNARAASSKSGASLLA
jgi:hypothetical protein